MSERATAALLVVVAGCSYQDVDLTGKACPCPEGWVCASDQTCQRANHPFDDAPTVRDLADTPQNTSCLSTPFTTLAYTTTFGDFDAVWKIGGGTWPHANGLQQTDALNGLAFAYVTAMGNASDYRVVSTMRQIDGAAGGAIEIAFRLSPNSTSMYHCNFEPNDGALLVQHTDQAIAGSVLTELQTQFDVSQAKENFTMEVQVVGSSIECCLDGISGAHVATTNTLYPTGVVGLKDYLMSSAHRDFAVYVGP